MSTCAERGGASATPPPKLPPSEHCLLVFPSLDNPILLSVNGTCDLLLNERNGDGDKMSTLRLLCCLQLRLVSKLALEAHYYLGKVSDYAGKTHIVRN